MLKSLASEFQETEFETEEGIDKDTYLTAVVDELYTEFDKDGTPGMNKDEFLSMTAQGPEPEIDVGDTDHEV